MQVPGHLQVQPERGVPAEDLGEPDGGIRCQAAPAPHDLVDPAPGDTEGPGEAVLGESLRLQWIDLAWLAPSLLGERHPGARGLDDW